MIQEFNTFDIIISNLIGYEVDVAINFSDPGNILVDDAKKLRMFLEKVNVYVYDIPSRRKSIHPCN
ncbi:hypothetical protein ACS60S_00915 [Streptococcus suis]|nr:hypothetical protein [Streptococcus suis]HEP1803129.1 hypothetical protein [Streptococcus suis]